MWSVKKTVDSTILCKYHKEEVNVCDKDKTQYYQTFTAEFSTALQV